MSNPSTPASVHSSYSHSSIVFAFTRFQLSARAEDAPSFRNQVQPILARFGCSSGACHGAAAGQGGFKLSLRGYDDEGDYLQITRSVLGPARVAR